MLNSNASIVVESKISRDGFDQFEQLIINYTQLIPTNGKQKLRIFGFAADVDTWSGLPHDLLCLGLS